MSLLLISLQPITMPQKEEFNPKPKENPYNPIEKDSNVNHLSKSIISSEKINKIDTSALHEIGWLVKKDDRKSYIKPKHPVASTEIVTPPGSSTVKPLVFGEVKIIKSLYTKSNNPNEKQDDFEDDQYLNKSSASANHPKLIHPNHTPSDSKDVDSKKLALKLLGFNLQIFSFARHGDLEKCHSILDEIRLAGLVSDTYSYHPMIHALVKKGRHKEAWDLLNKMQCMGVKPNVVTYNILLEVYKNPEDRKALKALLLEMKQALVKPNVVTYRILMGFCFKKGDLKEAWSLLQEMKEEEIEHDAELYEIFLKNCMEKRKFKYCEAILHEMEQMNIKPSKQICSMMKKLYNIKTGNCISNERVVKSANLLKQMESAGIRLDIASCNMTLYSYLEYVTQADGDLQKVKIVQESMQRLFQHMEKEGIQPDRETHEILMDFIQQIGDQESDSKSADSKTSTMKLLSFNLQIFIFAGNGDLEKCHSILNEIKQSGLVPDVYSYHPIIHALAKKGFHQKARDVLNEMQRMGIKPVVTYNTLMEAYKNLEDREGFRDLLSEMKQALIKPDVVTYTIMMEFFSKKGDLEGAWSLLQEMEKEKIELNAKLCKKYLKICIKKSNLKYCEVILQEMKNIGIEPNKEAWKNMRNLYNVKIGDYINNKKLVKSSNLLKRMESAGIRLDIVSYNMILRCYLKYGTQGEGDLQAKVKTVQVYIQRLLLQLEKEGIQPDEETYEILMQFNSKLEIMKL